MEHPLVSRIIVSKRRLCGHAHASSRWSDSYFNRWIVQGRQGRWIGAKVGISAYGNGSISENWIRRFRLVQS